MLTSQDMAARVGKLTKLLQALAKEGDRLSPVGCPLLTLESRACLPVIQAEVSGLDDAQVVVLQVRFEKIAAHMWLPAKARRDD